MIIIASALVLLSSLLPMSFCVKVFECNTRNAISQYMAKWSLTLRFTTDEMEYAYVKHLMEDVPRTFRILCGVSLIFSVYSLIKVGFRASAMPASAQRQVMFCKMWCWIFVACALIFGAAVLHLLPKCKGGVFALEKFASVFMQLIMTMLVLLDRKYMTALLGYDFRDVWGPDADISDTRALLHICLVVTVAHALAPARSQFLLLTGFCGVLTYVDAAFGIGSISDLVVPNVISLCAISVVASVGARRLEAEKRRNFRSMISEKTNRSKAEFELSRMIDQERPTAGVAIGKDALSQKSSCSSTTRSERIFAADSITLADVRRIGTAEHWLIEEADIRVDTECLGSGSFGSVVTGDYHGTIVAVKKFQHPLETEQAVTNACDELRILRRLRHPNMVTFYGGLVDFQTKSISLVMERLWGVELQALIIGSKGVKRLLTMRERTCVLTDVCGGIRYLHSLSPVVVHGDLKPSNIMVDHVAVGDSANCWLAKLLDFGLSRVITRHAKPLGGSVAFMAPEILRQGDTVTELASACDVFSFGKVAFFVFTSQTVFPTRKELTGAAGMGQLKWPASALKDELVDKSRYVIDNCCQPEYCMRPAIVDVHRSFAALAGVGVHRSSAALACERVLQCSGELADNRVANARITL
eukprot:TRINITY_DN12156_c0_g1_i1.p1 TRINITY_DN12156_c0_g1~~TRINITY_DN12156_c0_g1_i1.p1  ORF type:complete len:643 (-),score=48.84 TRINITY_DN12156_c0_g1_i1:5-1933(-)